MEGCNETAEHYNGRRSGIPLCARCYHKVKYHANPDMRARVGMRSTMLQGKARYRRKLYDILRRLPSDSEREEFMMLIDKHERQIGRRL